MLEAMGRKVLTVVGIQHGTMSHTALCASRASQVRARDPALPPAWPEGGCELGEPSAAQCPFNVANCWGRICRA